ncbi:MAG: peptide chain release factor 3 [Planctomycetota bacterium]|nr:MAG: peptide chain release factor 3 [Planctomycetota bacterium]
MDHRPQLEQEVAKRRTFAIISHPDAGKTTLTEKLLLYSGLLRSAGMVKKAKGGGLATSDWMAMEQERGISVTASAMQFPYRDRIINVLDTPGHQDFADDTFRTLTAADAAIMVLDAAKGVETQTRKLFEACRLRGTPVLTFINKMDTEGRSPLDLMAEVEDILGIGTFAWNWPVGMGRDFCGLIERSSRQFMRFEKAGVAGSKKAIIHRHALDESAGWPLDEGLRERLIDEVDLLDVAGDAFSQEDFLAAKVSPVFFGSALTNFGIEPFFDAFVDLAPCPGPRTLTHLDSGEAQDWAPATAPFSAYVFKIQANMDPKHRDSLAFVRVCSGLLERDTVVKQIRQGEILRELRLSRPATMVAQERTTLDAAYPGDVVGLLNAGFAIGDSIIAAGVSRQEACAHAPLPVFAPAVFARVVLSDNGKRKSFDKGISQLANEGSVLLLAARGRSGEAPIVAALGRLQFEVLQSRLQLEYGAPTNLQDLPFTCAAWLDGDVNSFTPPTTALVCEDDRGHIAVLFTSEWDRSHAARQNPNHRLQDHL